jgi:anaerobic ribonucleoside-triphosphate reductase
MIKCHDCQRELAHNEEYVPYSVGETPYAKCKECFEKDPVLKNFQECLVYSRVVGFHTAVKNWNAAKQEEWKDRKTYSNFQSCCE